MEACPRFNHVIELVEQMTKSPRSSPRRRRARPARRRAAPPADTRERILDAAERLFAERGIDAVSMRSVLAAARLNVSLVHYHFGGRDGLLEALLRRRVEPITEERLRRLREVQAKGSAATIEDVLRAYYEHPSPDWLDAHPAYARLLGQIQLSPSAEVRRIVRAVLRDSFAPFAEALAARFPRDLAPVRQICRLYLVLGVGAFAMTAFGDMKRSARKHLGAGGSLDARTVSDELVRFCAAGLSAPARGGAP
jgi:AcrR family transcriptional regulator